MNAECSIVNASSFPEFFYKDSHVQVSEGQPVGVEIETSNSVEFILFNYIYWNPDFSANE